MSESIDTSNIVAATIDGVRVDVETFPGWRGLKPPFGGGGYVTESQWHLLSNTVFHTN